MIYFKDNLLFLRKKKRLTQGQLGDKLGVGRTTITNYEAGLSEPSYEILNQIATILDVSLSELLNEDIQDQEDNPRNIGVLAKSKGSRRGPDDESNPTKVPLLPQSAQAGFSSFDISISRSSIEFYFDVPFLKEKADFAIMIEGDSMQPYYSSGSYILCKNVSGIADIRWERAYLISVNHAPMVKRIYPSTNIETILLRSDNPRFRDIEVLRSDISGIAKILATINFEDAENQPIHTF